MTIGRSKASIVTRLSVTTLDTVRSETKPDKRPGFSLACLEFRELDAIKLSISPHLLVLWSPNKKLILATVATIKP